MRVFYIFLLLCFFNLPSYGQEYSCVDKKYSRLSKMSIKEDALTFINERGLVQEYKIIDNSQKALMAIKKDSDENDPILNYIFIIKDNILKTPALQGSILPGITRDSVLKIADGILDLDIEEGDVTIHELLNADEVFFTGTAVVVAPVGSVSLDSSKYKYRGDFENSLTKQIRDSLLDIQNEKTKDPYDWITKVK